MSDNSEIQTPEWFNTWKDVILKIIAALSGQVSTGAASTTTPIPLKSGISPEVEVPANFDQAAVYCGLNEGGYVNHPADKGGPTNFGITIGTLSKWLGHQASIDEVKNLTKETALKIYKSNYWDVLQLDSLVDQGVATCMLDMGLLCGPGVSAKWAQEICKVKVDLKIGPVTLAAINNYDGIEFIKQFSQKAKVYFSEIVKRSPSQSVFLNGWNNRANRLVSTFASGPKPPESPASGNNEIGAGLVSLAMLNGFNGQKMQELIDYQVKNKPGSNPRYWGLIKLTDHSKTKRFALFDRIEKKCEVFYVAHGKNSDPQFTGWATVFSNVNGSNCSSLGIYRGAEFYEMAGHGTAMRLDGLSPSNSNARARGIVMHKALGYVSDAYVAANGKCGRSLGCPALDPLVTQGVIDKLRNGSLINFY
jgi:lysozyme family protein